MVTVSNESNQCRPKSIGVGAGIPFLCKTSVDIMPYIYIFLSVAIPRTSIIPRQ
ncbi:hypothetical protein HanIR_Chr10g0475311 [Helianthus annuus]|nr:hypothetical protein HanIR_Chr10g0475311 [Helianthus annuus]